MQNIIFDIETWFKLIQPSNWDWSDQEMNSIGSFHWSKNSFHLAFCYWGPPKRQTPADHCHLMMRDTALGSEARRRSGCELGLVHLVPSLDDNLVRYEEEGLIETSTPLTILKTRLWMGCYNWSSSIITTIWWKSILESLYFNISWMRLNMFSQINCELFYHYPSPKVVLV